ncbi:MAG: alanine racemase [Bacteroides sp.]|nr:alanine racemase [Bacteroides sp.]
MNLTIPEIASITGGTVVGAPAANAYTTLLTDSRSLDSAAGTVFCALRTGSSDGHRYIAAMAHAGVDAFLVEDLPAPLPPGCAAIRVPSVARAIEALGAHERDTFGGTLVAVTGSAGKTVVKEMLYRGLLGVRRTHRSPRSWNSRLGVPLTLSEMPADTEVAVVEVGIDSPGDMDAHARMLRPQVGVLTAITDEHSAGFISLEAKIREKARLFDSCEVIFYDSTSPLSGRVLHSMYPSKRLVAVEGSDPADTDNRLAAAVAGMLGAPAVAPTAPVSSRLDVHEGVNDCLMVYDNFTHDLRSLRSALDFMRRRSVARRSDTVVLGDLLHAPADDVAAIYRAAGLMMARFGIGRVIAAGAEAATYASELSAVGRVESTVDFCTDYDIDLFSGETILIFGDTEAGFADIRDRLESPRHHTVLEVNLDALVHNFNYYRSLLRPDTGIIAMVKASAYGTGAPGVARTLQAQGASYLAVAVADEGVELRRAGIDMPIMVLNPITTNYKALFDYRLEPSVFSLPELQMLLSRAERCGVADYPIHIKLDTGMHRVGFVDDELPALIDLLTSQTRLRVATIFSHLATADCLDLDDYTAGQLDAFRRMSEQVQRALPYPTRRHVLNTAGAMRYPDSQYDLVRPGIGLYGVSPLPGESPLRVVASLYTTIFSIKRWDAGTTIGYGCRGVLTRPSVIATLPIGYADGLDRHLSCGAASFIVRGVRCPVVGNICMDQCMIDVTDVADAAPGDRVEIFGSHAPVETLADTLGTIPYEILTSVSPRVKRIYFRE